MKSYKIYKFRKHDSSKYNESFQTMPSVRGSVHDVVNKRSFTIELEGPKATLVHVWSKASYCQPDKLLITQVPLVMGTDSLSPDATNTGDVKECDEGEYVLGELLLEDIIVPTVGRFYDTQRRAHFQKQAFIKPLPSQKQVVERYEQNGVKVLTPHPNPNVDEESLFPVVLTLIGSVRHLLTPLPKPSPTTEDLAIPGPSSMTDSSFSESSFASSSISEILTGTANLVSPRSPDSGTSAPAQGTGR